MARPYSAALSELPLLAFNVLIIIFVVAGLPLAAINPSAAFGTTSNAGASGAGQILGQTGPVAAATPQLILTGSTLPAQGGQTPMQQLLIPVSTGERQAQNSPF